MSESTTGTRLFTVEEANALLPNLEPIVQEMLQAFKEIRAEIEAAAAEANLPPGSPELSKRLEDRGQAPRLFTQVKGLIERIHSNGCLVNGPEAGLIDFPCLFNNEIVFLCWKFGERQVGHWHRIPEGFAGRRPLLDDSPASEPGRVH
ncbi:MAG: DUF2203 domain-containing protein [Candidatus Polarisedimenticolia bacterium]